MSHGLVNSHINYDSTTTIESRRACRNGKKSLREHSDLINTFHSKTLPAAISQIIAAAELLNHTTPDMFYACAECKNSDVVASLKNSIAWPVQRRLRHVNVNSDDESFSLMWHTHLIITIWQTRSFIVSSYHNVQLDFAFMTPM